MISLMNSIFAATFPSTIAAESDRLAAYLVIAAPGALIALFALLAWFFLSDQPRIRYR